MLYDKLPDDLLTYIYSKILYPKHKNFLTEIKLRPIIIFEWTHINHQVLKKTLYLLKKILLIFFY